MNNQTIRFDPDDPYERHGHTPGWPRSVSTAAALAAALGTAALGTLCTARLGALDWSWARGQGGPPQESVVEAALPLLHGMFTVFSAGLILIGVVMIGAVLLARAQPQRRRDVRALSVKLFVFAVGWFTSVAFMLPGALQRFTHG